MRAATIYAGGSAMVYLFRSTRPVRAATQILGYNADWLDVSIHAARAGRDVAASTSGAPYASFDPRGPCGPRRKDVADKAADAVVSIHAARAGRDM
ncbi:hypothetical protein SAHY_09533 [Salinisphaera hydrothermalis EPR70]